METSRAKNDAPGILNLAVIFYTGRKLAKTLQNIKKIGLVNSKPHSLRAANAGAIFDKVELNNGIIRYFYPNTILANG